MTMTFEMLLRESEAWKSLARWPRRYDGEGICRRKRVYMELLEIDFCWDLISLQTYIHNNIIDHYRTTT